VCSFLGGNCYETEARPLEDQEREQINETVRNFVVLTITIAIVLLLAGLFTAAATKPDGFRVQRTAVMDAPPEKIFPMIEDFHQWVAWSPYEKMDPDMKRIYSGAPKGKGAVYEWEGKGKVGAGRMEITELIQSTRVTIKLDFIKPFVGHQTAEFTLESSGQSTTVTWAAYGPSSFISKLMSVFFNMDRLLGNDFEKGLSNLTALAGG
jgi:hypothetical protein